MAADDRVSVLVKVVGQRGAARPAHEQRLGEKAAPLCPRTAPAAARARLWQQRECKAEVDGREGARRGAREQVRVPLEEGPRRRLEHRRILRRGRGEHAAERRADHDAKAHRKAHKREDSRLVRWVGDVGQVDLAHGDAACRRALEQPERERAHERWRHREREQGERSHCHAEEHHRPPPEPVAQVAVQGRDDELAELVRSCEHPRVQAHLRLVDRRQLAHVERHERHDQHHVERVAKDARDDDHHALPRDGRGRS